MTDVGPQRNKGHPAPRGPARWRLRQPLLRRARFLTAQPGSCRGLPGPRAHAARPSRRRGVRSPATVVRRGRCHHRRSDRRCLAAAGRRTPRRRAARGFDRRSDRRAHRDCPDTHVAVARADRLRCGGPTIFIYDGHPGGVGITRQGFARFEVLVADAHRLIAECPCEKGCPSCVQSPKCGNLNEPLAKAGSLELMARMLGAERPGTLQDRVPCSPRAAAGPTLRRCASSGTASLAADVASPRRRPRSPENSTARFAG